MVRRLPNESQTMGKHIKCLPTSGVFWPTWHKKLEIYTLDFCRFSDNFILGDDSILHTFSLLFLPSSRFAARGGVLCIVVDCGNNLVILYSRVFKQSKNRVLRSFYWVLKKGKERKRNRKGGIGQRLWQSTFSTLVPIQSQLIWNIAFVIGELQNFSRARSRGSKCVLESKYTVFEIKFDFQGPIICHRLKTMYTIAIIFFGNFPWQTDPQRKGKCAGIARSRTITWLHSHELFEVAQFLHFDGDR